MGQKRAERGKSSTYEGKGRQRTRGWQEIAGLRGVGEGEMAKRDARGGAEPTRRDNLSVFMARIHSVQVHNSNVVIPVKDHASFVLAGIKRLPGVMHTEAA